MKIQQGLEISCFAFFFFFFFFLYYCALSCANGTMSYWKDNCILQEYSWKREFINLLKISGSTYEVFLHFYHLLRPVNRVIGSSLPNSTLSFTVLAKTRFAICWLESSMSVEKTCIMKTCLCNSEPLKPHFYKVKLGFTGVYIIFLMSA